MTALDSIGDLERRMAASIIGQEDVVRNLVIGLLANGNILMEGLPGLAKTRAVKGMASSMDADFSRIQFTPDLLPSDITGSEVLYTESGQPTFRFEAGPIFANIVLADEINRAPAKVQSALLEAMEERQVTVSGTSHAMPALFMVMATQNPIEQEGTYPLPEAQMDRFLMHVYVDYPDEAPRRRSSAWCAVKNSLPTPVTRLPRSARRWYLPQGKRSTGSRSARRWKNTSWTWCSRRATRNVTVSPWPTGSMSGSAPGPASPWTSAPVCMPGSKAVTTYCPKTCRRWCTGFSATALTSATTPALTASRPTT